MIKMIDAISDFRHLNLLHTIGLAVLLNFTIVSESRRTSEVESTWRLLEKVTVRTQILQKVSSKKEIFVTGTFCIIAKTSRQLQALIDFFIPD